VPSGLVVTPTARQVATLFHWEETSTSPAGKPTSVEIRTSEVLAKTDGKWLYLIDHASIGLPPPKAAPKPVARAESGSVRDTSGRRSSSW
jgi:hypothetical protein